jgi:hypothetical protein
MQPKRNQPQNPAADSLTVARQLLIALNGAFKKILLYPPEHVICRTALNTFKNSLDRFLLEHGNLVLFIDRNQIRYQNEVVHEGPLNEENLAYLLFRDGIFHLEFQKSIEPWEIHLLLELLKKNQTLTEEAENDIVTALWELELPGLRYKAEDVGFDTGEDFEIPELDGYASSQDAQDMLTAEAGDTVLAPPPHHPVNNQDLWEITSKDRKHLKNMLTQEEDWESIEYVLYILLYILQQQTQPNDFSEVMAFLNQEIQDALKDHKYKSVFSTLHILRMSKETNHDRNHWSIPLLEDFFKTLSGETFLHIFHGNWGHISRCDPEELNYLKRALILLDEDVIQVLGPMLLEAHSQQTKSLLLTVIGIMAERTFTPLENLLSSPNPDLVKSLVPVMGFMKGEVSLKRLYELQRHTASDVRKQALKAIYRRDPEMIGELLWLLDDPDEEVRQLFLSLSCRKRSLKTERLFLDYLKSQRIRSANKQFLFRVFISLGKCGSDASLPFLKKNLYVLPRLGILRFKRSLRRQAAEYALKEIKTSKAKSTLNVGSKRGRSTPINEKILT